MDTREPQTIRVGTLNLRNTSDRWPERAGLLIDQISALGPDIIGFQELRRPSWQGRRITEGANASLPDDAVGYRLYRAWKSGIRWFWEGLAVLTELPVISTARLVLPGGFSGGNRIAQRVTVRLPNGNALDLYNTHLHHAEGDDIRLRQVESLLEWIQRRVDYPHVLVGDFNAQPDDPSIELITASKVLTSAYFAVHGVHPDRTSPAPLSDEWGQPGKVIDFIFVSEQIRVHESGLAFDEPDHSDPRLSASDHYGLSATISIRSQA